MESIEKMKELRELAIEIERAKLKHVIDLVNLSIAQNAELLAIEIAHQTILKSLDPFDSTPTTEIILSKFGVENELSSVIQSLGTADNIKRNNYISSSIDRSGLFSTRIGVDSSAKSYLVYEGALDLALRKYGVIPPKKEERGENIRYSFNMNLEEHTLRKVHNSNDK